MNSWQSMWTYLRVNLHAYLSIAGDKMRRRTPWPVAGFILFYFIFFHHSIFSPSKFYPK